MTASSSDEGASDSWVSRWDAMKAELDMLAVESDNTCTLVRIALTRHARLRATLQQKGASITASSGSERRRKPNNSSATRHVEKNFGKELEKNKLLECSKQCQDISSYAISTYAISTVAISTAHNFNQLHFQPSAISTYTKFG